MGHYISYTWYKVTRDPQMGLSLVLCWIFQYFWLYLKPLRVLEMTAKSQASSFYRSRAIWIHRLAGSRLIKHSFEKIWPVPKKLLQGRALSESSRDSSRVFFRTRTGTDSTRTWLELHVGKIDSNSMWCLESPPYVFSKKILENVCMRASRTKNVRMCTSMTWKFLEISKIWG